MREKMIERAHPFQIIRLEELKLLARLGWYEEERAHPQMVLLTLAATVPLVKASETDDLKDTINYEEILKLLEQACNERSWKLIERMQREIAVLLFDRFPKIESLSLSIKKNVFTQASHVSVELVCSREDLAPSPKSSKVLGFT